MWYCACDVKLPVAEEILKRPIFVLGEKAHPQNGWLPPKAIDQIREAIKQDVSKITKRMDEEEMKEGIEEAWWGEPLKF
ncbi:unnamed protein product [Thelazia callipaeda]|uniref:1-acyl-sn-glycerol-3-phosphate acyltransferase n=1 Tax=Thelazia callipaeda TaxID=103827 RepID=A0A0N5D2R1_THECL|nr:unnamed protein product [Thelazia callipaeda]